MAANTAHAGSASPANNPAVSPQAEVAKPLKANPLEGVDSERPLIEKLEKEYNEWLRALADHPLDEEDAHSICAHCLFGTLGIVQARDLIMTFLRKQHLISEDFIHPSKVGFDPRNRDDLGGNWNGVHDHMSTIKRVGWSDLETANAVCAQIIPGDKTVELFNQTLTEDVPLKQVAPGELEYSSLACGHTNCGLRAIEAACLNADPRLSQGGRMSKEWIAKTDEPFAVAVDRGLKWTILHYAVRTKYPECLIILIAAYNVYGSVQQKTSEVQGLMQMHRLSKQMHDCGKIPDWKHIKGAILKSEPPFAEDIDFLAEFVIGKAGDNNDVTYLQCFVASHRQFVAAKKRIPGEVYGALADFSLVNMAWAVCLTAYCGPPSARAKGHVCDYVSATAVRALEKKVLAAQATTEKCSYIADLSAMRAVVETGKTAAACEASEVILLQVKRRLKAAGLPEKPETNNRLNKCLTWLSEALARFVLGKDQREGREVSHLHGCAWHFLEDVKKEFPDVKVQVLTATWPTSKAKAAGPQKQASTASASAAPVEQHLYAMDKFGVVVDPIAKLRAHSWDIGTVVGVKSEPDSIYTIAAVEANQVVRLEPCFPLAVSAFSETKMLHIDLLLLQMVIKKTADVKIQHPCWKAVRPIDTDIELSYERAFATWAVAKISKYCERAFHDVFDQVDCLSKPKQMAIAKAECPVGQLIIAPRATKILSCLTAKLGEVTQDTRAQVTLIDTVHKDHTFYAHPWIDQKHAAAFWFVEATDDPSKANMSYAMGSYDLAGGAELTAPEGITIVCGPANAEAAGSAASKLVGKQAPVKVVNPPEDAHNHIVRVRTLVNHKVLMQGDVLKVFDKGVQRGEKRPGNAAAPISVAKVMRKRWERDTA